ncbi:response regulator [Paenibacillus hexagrammi]|uniref:Response regulator n=1 Tax=Paenibacillus hexagrammi TaxID=2908839 RepID=A0ABY3SGH8_9BACL|nr:response regulator [Paenibacillus sp. YPD9-1]UJF32565.1 response regulator [Paenibacillus sp. YPD9-1]
MKKVFLVDDEIIVREGVRGRIDWAAEGYIYCGDAEDGEIALPLIEAAAPDIVITDIKMPFMDGLQLSKILKQKMPDIKIIILSGHDEFQYARDALRIGITEYCLKPFSSGDLLQTLAAVSKQIDAEKKKKQEIESLRQEIHKSVNASKEKLLLDLCFGSITAAEALEASSALEINVLSRFYRVILTEFVMIDAEPAAASTASLNQACCELEQRLLALGDHLHFRRNKKEWVWILKGDHPDRLEETVQHLLNQLKPDVEAVSPYRLIIGVGSIRDRIQEISSSFMEADEDRSYQRIWNKYQFIQIRGGTDSLQDFLQFDRNQLLDFLKFGEYARIKDFTDSYASGVKGYDWSNSLYGYYFLMDVTVTTAQWLKEASTDHEEILREIESCEKKIVQIRSWQEALEFIENILRMTVHFRMQLKDSSTSIVQKAKDYIHQHYDEADISLQTVASYVNTSPSYFSSLFSQETGQTFIEFVTKTRMKKAMELLKSTNAKSYEIAYQVGYQDANYFSNLFKKITGKTTKDFRKEG